MARRPILNPLLTLVAPPQPRPAPGGGKGANDIRDEYFERRRKRLIKSFGELAASAKLKRCAKADRVLIRVTMDDKSAAPSYTPRDLFSADSGAELVAPWRRGYLAEVNAAALKRLAQRLTGDRLPIAIRVDVSRVKAVSLLAADLLDQDFEGLWSKATVLEGTTRLFLGSLAPFRTKAAREALVADLRREGLRYGADSGDHDGAEDSVEIGPGQLLPIMPALPVSIEALRAAVNQRGAFVTLACSSVDVLQRLVVRVDRQMGSCAASGPDPGRSD
ncbi:MAG: hypothetical protein EOR69_32205 [Mesorhizobium sp.]|nr:MAG: hypothetical protein EOR69_32205 [Mesorhizobium sp.]RWL92878.1 MAG: hypothetical protein EOR70_30290 [Mesorhizobium sp.]